MEVTLATLFDRLLAHYGPQAWWPGETPLEVMVGAVLTQNTNWKNVERAIENLREADLLDLHSLGELPLEELAELIRPAGYYRLKAGRLHRLLQFVRERYDGSLEAMFAMPLEDLREELLGVNGIGPETADSILLYAGGLPTFVIDAYTHRVMKRHGWIEFEADYHQLKEHFESGLERDAATFNEFHALFVQLGKDYCRKEPRCDGCPLHDWLPEQGPLEPDW
ncbi:MAG: endonuclease III domain-containing protein [Pirellulales bacterium]|nr:endonuclease III domain-containing protein [Pirellulales bacterium]